MINQAGIYPEVSPEEYARDPVAAPSLTASLAHVLLSRSPLHAWQARIDRMQGGESTEAQNLGSVAHRLLIGRGCDFEVVEADDWRTKAAQESRKAIRAAGKVPILAGRFAEAEAMVAAARGQLSGPPFRQGQGEVCLVWREGEVWCRSMLDWLHDRGDGWIDIADYKTTSGSAHPATWGRRAFLDGLDIQAEFYRRGLQALRPNHRVTFTWIVQETCPPYALSLVRMDRAGETIARKKIETAISLWGRCLNAGIWPGYPAETVEIELPGWAENAWLARETSEEALQADADEALLRIVA